MTSPDSNSMEVLSGLLEERRRYEGWIAQLEARRASTPPHVFDKVRADYEHRLRSVMEQLGSRASELETSVRSFESRAASLLAEENARRDERAEAELRAAVGEYTPEAATELLTRTDEAIGQFAAERAGIVAELERLQEILDQVRPGSAPPEAPREIPQAAPAAAPVAAPVAAPSVATVAQPPAPATPPSVPAQGTGFDELAFLQSVVEPRAPQGTPAGSAAAAASAPPPSRAPESSGRHPGTSGTPAFLKGMPAEQAKTLKCQECGTMNYATEWYCERCGGELAAM